MGARYDKYDPIAGGFRAPLAADLTPDANGEFGPVGVSLNASGRVVVGSTAGKGLMGVMIKNVPKVPAGIGAAAQALTGIWQGVKAGDIVDVMTSGEIVDFNNAIAAGVIVYSSTAGVLSTTNTGFPIGFTVEVGRLVVRVPLGRAAGAVA